MLIDKVTNRKILLLDLLYASNGLSLQEIELELKLSMKTIKSELKDLLVDCPYSQEELSIKKIGNKYSLVQEEKVTIELVKMSFKKIRCYLKYTIKF